MRTARDARRSMSRFASVVLGSEWEVRPWGTEGELRFPFARVAAITPVSADGAVAWREVSQTFAIHAYPEPQDTPDAAISESERVQELLYLGFEAGWKYQDFTHPDPPASPVVAATVEVAPRRVPLYDYEGVPDDGPTAWTNARQPHDYLRVVTVSLNDMVDPEDDRYRVVIAEARCTWRRMGRLPSGSQLVQSVRLRESSVS